MSEVGRDRSRPHSLRCPHVLRLVAGLVVLVLTTALAVSGVLPGPAGDLVPAAQAAPGPTGTSSDGRITLSMTASPPSLPAGGGTSTLTYSVTNTTGYRAYYVGLSDTECPSPRPASPSGLVYDGGRWYIEAGKTATFTCALEAGITTTPTATATFRTSADGRTWTESSATAAVTVPVANNPCEQLWYASGPSGATPGTLGTIDILGTAAMKPWRAVSSLVPTQNGSFAIGIDTKNSSYGYFFGTSDYRLYRFDRATGAVAMMNTGTANHQSVRLVVASDGTVWSWDVNGILWSWNPAVGGPWTRHDITRFTSLDPTIALPTNTSSLASGDLEADGDGNLWLLAADSIKNITYLIAIPKSETAKSSMQARVVGRMNPPTGGGYYNGLAFGPRGRLFASSSNDTTRINTLHQVDLNTGATTQVSSAPYASVGQIGDLGSCASPHSRLQVLKRASTAAPAVTSGDTITYTITVSNLGGLAAVDVTAYDAIPANTTYVPGSTTLNGVAVPDATGGVMPYSVASPRREVHSTSTNRPGLVAAGEKATVSFTVKVNDGLAPDLKSIDNTAMVVDINHPSGITSDDPTTPDPDATKVPIARPAIKLTKSATPSAVVGDGTVTYTYVVENTGAEPLAGIVLADAATRGGTSLSPYACASPVLTSGDVDGDGMLGSYEQWTFTCTDDLSWKTADGTGTTNVVNTATVTAYGAVTSQKVTATSGQTVTVNPRPASLSMSKTVLLVGPADTGTGDFVVSYSVVVHNSGQVATTYGPITDTPTLAPGTAWSAAPNAIEWRANSDDGNLVVATDQQMAGTSSFTMGTLSGGTPGRTTIGPGATHRYLVRLKQHWTRMPDATSASCTSGGGVRNSVALPAGEETEAPAGGGSVTSDNAACADAPQPTAGITLVKSAVNTDGLDGANVAGDKVDYIFTVTNTSLDLFLRVIAVRDANLDGPAPCAKTDLAPGESTTCTGTHTVTSGDLSAGFVRNTATAVGTPPGFASPIESAPASVTVPLNTSAAVTLSKTADDTGIKDKKAGDTVTYTFEVTNSGTKDLTDITINDPVLGLTSLSCAPAGGILGNSAKSTCTAPYTLKQEDIDRGLLVNTATVQATGIEDGVKDVVPVEASSSFTLRGLGGKTGLYLEKIAPKDIIDSDSSEDTSVGDAVRYRFFVRNLTEESLELLDVIDPMVETGGNQVVCEPTTLAPGEAADCHQVTAHALTASELKNATLVNTAHATAKVVGSGDPGTTVTSNDASATIGLPFTSKLTLKKIAGPLTEGTITADTPVGPSKGDAISYSFEVTNESALPMTGASVTDAMLTGQGITISCPPTIAARATVTCTTNTPYVLSRADVDKRAVTNTATATATDGRGGSVTSNESSTTTPVIPLPRLLLDKAHTASADPIVAGTTVTYTFTLRNDGAGTLTDLTISDPMLKHEQLPADAPADAELTPKPFPCLVKDEGRVLQPGESVTCDPVTYTVTQWDYDHLGATNVATASATSGKGSATPVTLTAIDEDRFDTGTPTGAMNVVKKFDQLQDVDLSGTPTVGDLLHYHFEVTNTGTATLRFLAVDDEKIDLVGLACGTVDIPPATTMVCHAPVYTLTEADQSQLTSFTNTATAHAETYAGETITQKSDPVTSNLPEAPRAALTVTKKADRATATAGDAVSYSFEVTNTGTITVEHVDVVDPMLQAARVDVTCTPTTLPPGEKARCTASAYTVTSADAVLGTTLTNAAVATGDQVIASHGGAVVVDEGSEPKVVSGPATASVELYNVVPPTVPPVPPVATDPPNPPGPVDPPPVTPSPTTSTPRPTPTSTSPSPSPTTPRPTAAPKPTSTPKPTARPTATPKPTPSTTTPVTVTRTASPHPEADPVRPRCRGSKACAESASGWSHAPGAADSGPDPLATPLPGAPAAVEGAETAGTAPAVTPTTAPSQVVAQEVPTSHGGPVALVAATLLGLAGAFYLRRRRNAHQPQH